MPKWGWGRKKKENANQSWVHTCSVCGLTYEVPAQNSTMCWECAIKKYAKPTNENAQFHSQSAIEYDSPSEEPAYATGIGELLGNEILHECANMSLPMIEHLDDIQYRSEAFYLFLFAADLATYTRFGAESAEKKAILDGLYNHLEKLDLLTPRLHQRLLEYSLAVQGLEVAKHGWEVSKVFAKAFDHEMDVAFMFHGTVLFNRALEGMNTLYANVQRT